MPEILSIKKKKESKRKYLRSERTLKNRKKIEILSMVIMYP